MKKKRLLILYLFAALFLISGAAGLIYQIVWERLLGLYFGVTMVSISLIVSAYMAGLGIGSLVGGRIARRYHNTLLLYGLLEIGIALFGVVSPRLIVWIGQATAGSHYALVFLISFAILLIPTTLMGMTLPLLTQSFVDRVETSGQVIGLLYGINTLGAAFGALLAGYLLIGFYGFQGATYIAVLINGLVGICALFLSRGPAIAVETKQPATPAAAVWGYRTVLLSSFFVGFIGLGFEMLWVRILLIVNKNTAYGFPSILFIFLLGLALGGYFWGRRADLSRNPVALFCQIELVGASVAALSFLLFAHSLQFNTPWMEQFFDSQKPSLPFVKVQHELFFSKRLLLSHLWNYFLPILGMILPASLIMGGGLPVLDRLSIHNPQVSGRRVGDIHLANIIGSVAGILVVSFILLPTIGSEPTFKFLVAATFLFPVLYFLDRSVDDRRQSTRRNDAPLIVLSLLALISVFLLPPRGKFYQRLYSFSTRQDAVISESGDSVLALTYEPGSAQQAGVFWIGGEVNSFFPPKGIYESRALVCAGASRPKRVLIIGFGGGYSALFYKSIPTVDEIVIVELLGDIAPFLTSNVHSAQVTLEDPRITYVVDDGRRYLNVFPDEKFDLISIDPLRDHTSGHNNLYSAEALTIYQRHLTPSGVLCAWMDEFHIIPHTVARVFPYVDQFENELVVASNNPIEYDTSYMDAAAESYSALTRELYGPDGEVRLSIRSTLDLFLRDQIQILTDEKHKQTLGDMYPWLEYYLFVKPVKEEIHSNPELVIEFKNRIR